MEWPEVALSRWADGNDNSAGEVQIFSLLHYLMLIKGLISHFYLLEFKNSADGKTNSTVEKYLLLVIKAAVLAQIQERNLIKCAYHTWGIINGNEHPT